MKAQFGNSCKAVLFCNLGVRWGLEVNATPRPFYDQERKPVLVVQEARWVSGPVLKGAEKFALTGIRSPDRLALRESLSWLRYSGLIILCRWGKEMSVCSESIWLHTGTWRQNAVFFCLISNIVVRNVTTGGWRFESRPEFFCCNEWAVGWGTVLQAGRSRVRSSMGSLEFFIDIILPIALEHWGRLSP